MSRWDYIRYIYFYDALEVVRDNSKLFNKSLHFESEQEIKQCITELLCRKNDFFNNQTYT